MPSFIDGLAFAVSLSLAIAPPPSRAHVQAVQATHPKVTSPFPCAAKQGDYDGGSKQQLDPRLPPHEKQVATARLVALCSTRAVDSDRVSAALRDAYVAVVRDKLLC